MTKMPGTYTVKKNGQVFRQNLSFEDAVSLQHQLFRMSHAEKVTIKRET